MLPLTLKAYEVPETEATTVNSLYHTLTFVASLPPSDPPSHMDPSFHSRPSPGATIVGASIKGSDVITST